jgi:hypothetical protein
MLQTYLALHERVCCVPMGVPEYVTHTHAECMAFLSILLRPNRPTPRISCIGPICHVSVFGSLVYMGCKKGANNGRMYIHVYTIDFTSLCWTRAYTYKDQTCTCVKHEQGTSACGYGVYKNACWTAVCMSHAHYQRVLDKHRPRPPCALTQNSSRYSLHSGLALEGFTLKKNI